MELSQAGIQIALVFTSLSIQLSTAAGLGREEISQGLRSNIRQQKEKLKRGVSLMIFEMDVPVLC